MLASIRLKSGLGNTYKLALGAKVHAVVDETRPGDTGKLVPEFTDAAIHDQAFEGQVRQTGERQTGGAMIQGGG